MPSSRTNDDDALDPGPPTSAGGGRFIDDYLSYLLSRSAYLVAQEFHAHVESMGLSTPVWRVLATLSDGDGLPIGDLARATLYKQPTLTRIIDRLESENIVVRAPDDNDRRRVLVCITEKGRAIVARLLVDAKRHEAAVLGGYTDSEIALLKDALRTLIRRSMQQREDAGRGES